MIASYSKPLDGLYPNSVTRKYGKKVSPQEIHMPPLWKRKQNSKAFRRPGIAQHNHANRGPLRGKRFAANDLAYDCISKQSKINIPGIDKIIRSPNHFSKLLWICVVPVFYGLCVYQLVDRFTVYFKHPVGLEIKILKNASVQFPSVAVCPPYGPYSTFIKLLNELDEIKYSDATRTFAELNTSLEEIWNESKIRDGDFYISSPCLTKKGDPCDELKVESYELKTFWGTCIVNRIRHNLLYRGPQTSITLRVVREENLITPEILQIRPWMQSIANRIMFVPHDHRISPLHEVVNLGYKVNRGQIVEVRFSIKEFHFLKTVDNPCVSQDAEVECRNNCVEKDLEQYGNCWLPFMKLNSSLDPCTTFEESIDAHFEIQRLYSANDGCNCPRQCDETVMTLLTDYHAADEPGYTQFTLSYPDNSIEVVTENYSYTLNSLISDVGGSLGFIVGLCLFSFIEVLDSIIQRCVMYFYSKCARSHERLGHKLNY